MSNANNAWIIGEDTEDTVTLYQVTVTHWTEEDHEGVSLRFTGEEMRLEEASSLVQAEVKDRAAFSDCQLKPMVRDRLGNLMVYGHPTVKVSGWF